MFTAITVFKHDHRVILLDVPGSIEDAQSFRVNGHACRIRSSPPLSQPYPSNEPKGHKLAEALNAIQPETLQRNQCLEKTLVFALNACKVRLGNHGIPWCLPRVLQTPLRILSPLADGNRFRSTSDIRHCSVINPSVSQTVLEVGGHHYLIPAKSVFVLSSIEDGLYCFDVAAEMFDLILMDPPWKNRSVRRSSTYTTHENQHQDPFIQTLPVLKKHLKAGGLVAVWVTNKLAIRVQVVDALRVLDLLLVAEWTWLKVTDQGEPVTEINGVWRKPYETLLIFSCASVVMPRQTIIAVPDVHSRKPSLKRLLAAYLPESYSALEIFARSLTAGWWSFGNQVLKFQDVCEWDFS